MLFNLVLDDCILICEYNYMLIEDATLERFTNLLKAVADPNRRYILFLLRHKGEMNVGNIAKELNLSQPMVSQHLKILRDAGALKARKEHQMMYYSIASILVCDALMEFLSLYQKESKN